MTIDEAIGLLDVLECQPVIQQYYSSREAIKLGIEALKRIQGRRDLGTGWERTPLPGEPMDKEGNQQ